MGMLDVKWRSSNAKLPLTSFCHTTPVSICDPPGGPKGLPRHLDVCESRND